jgi:GH15 family glucan-1,4-alpha-glucosidase
VGTASQPASQVWFTVSHGILNEIYWPEVDRVCTRDMGFIVTDGKEFFSEEKRHTKHKVEYLAGDVPAFRLTNECEDNAVATHLYRIAQKAISNAIKHSKASKVTVRLEKLSKLSALVIKGWHWHLRAPESPPRPRLEHHQASRPAYRRCVGC